MSEKIQLIKWLKAHEDGATYVSNLVQIVDNLMATPYAKKHLILYDNKLENISRIEQFFRFFPLDILYGYTSDGSKDSEMRQVKGYSVQIKNLYHLKHELNKTHKYEKSDFRISRTFNVQNPFAFTESWPWSDMHRIRTMVLDDYYTHTNILAELADTGLVTIVIDFDPRSHKREMNRIKRTVSKLVEQKYKRS